MAAVDAVKASMLMKQLLRLQLSLAKSLLWCLISCYWTSFLCQWVWRQLMHIERNITCFTEKGQTFTTYADNQSGVLIQAFKRERMTAEDNNSLEKSHLDGSLQRHVVCLRMKPFSTSMRMEWWARLCWSQMMVVCSTSLSKACMTLTSAFHRTCQSFHSTLCD